MPLTETGDIRRLGWRQPFAKTFPAIASRPDLPSGGHGPRLWQSPAAALRQARHPHANEDSRRPIRHSSFCPRCPLRLCGQICVSSVLRRRRSAPARKPSPTQSNHAFWGGDSLSPQHSLADSLSSTKSPATPFVIRHSSFCPRSLCRSMPSQAQSNLARPTFA